MHLEVAIKCADLRYALQNDSLKTRSRQSGFSFEAGGRTFRPVVCHSTSGTLRSILAIFFTTVLYIFLTEASHEHTD